MRYRKLIRPGLQLRMTVWFACLSAVALGVQFILITGAMSEVALKMPGDAAKNFEIFSSAFNEVFLLSLVIVLPLAIMTGILATFRIAGPVFSIKGFLESALKGEQVEPCQLRKGDELSDICDLTNEVTASLRAANESKSANSSKQRSRAA